MALVQDHDAIQKLPSAASDPALGDTVLPGTPRCSPLRLDAHRLDHRDHALREDRVSVEHQVGRPGVVRERFPKLLHHPGCSRVLRDIEADDLPAAVVDQEPHGEDSKRHGRHHEEVHRRECLAVISNERPPRAHRSPARPYSRQIPRHGAFGDVESELRELAVDPGAPQVGFSHAIRTMSVRTSASSLGRPDARERTVQ